RGKGVERTSAELFARAAAAEQEHVVSGRGGNREPVAELPNGGGLADDAMGVCRAEGKRQARRVAAERQRPGPPRDQEHQGVVQGERVPRRAPRRLGPLAVDEQRALADVLDADAPVTDGLEPELTPRNARVRERRPVDVTRRTLSPEEQCIVRL